MASSSAALALPVIDSLGLKGHPVLAVTAQIAIADATSIVLLPLVINPSQAPKAALGGLAIAGCVAVPRCLRRSLRLLRGLILTRPNPGICMPHG
jgi:hypothetical protein